MAAKFDLKQGASGQFMFNLKAGNGEVILTSELYKQKQSAIAGIDSVKANAGDDNRYDRKTAKNGQPYFVLTAMEWPDYRQERNVFFGLGNGERDSVSKDEWTGGSDRRQYKSCVSKEQKPP